MNTRPVVAMNPRGSKAPPTRAMEVIGADDVLSTALIPSCGTRSFCGT